MIDHKRKIIFIHIPKCAGTFVESNLTPDIDWDKIGEKHLTMDLSIKKYGISLVRECFRFTVIRNPYTRILSFYLYHRRNKEMLFDISITDRFLRNFRTNYYDSFDDFIYNLSHYYHKLKSWAKNDLKPCSDFIENIYGIQMDLILRQESLLADINILEKKLDVSFIDKKVNSAPNKYDYNEYYSSFSRGFVEDFYCSDFYYFYNLRE